MKTHQSIIYNYFSYNSIKHLKFTELYESKVEITQNKKKDSISIYKFTEKKWKVMKVSRLAHTNVLNSIALDPESTDLSWRITVLHQDQIPSNIFRILRLNGFNFLEHFPNLVLFDQEYEIPPFCEKILNTRRYKNYIDIDPTNEDDYSENKQCDDFLNFESNQSNNGFTNVENDSVFSEFADIEKNDNRNFLFLDSNKKSVIIIRGQKIESNYHPYTVSAVLFCLAFSINGNNPLKSYDDLTYLLQKPDDKIKGTIESRYIEKIQKHILFQNILLEEYSNIQDSLDDTVLIENELGIVDIRNLFNFFEDIYSICKTIISFKSIAFDFGFIKTKTDISNEHCLLEFDRMNVSPIQLHTSLVLLSLKYSIEVSKNSNVIFNEKKIQLKITRNILDKIQRTYLPHLLITKKFPRGYESKVFLYPLMTWNYVFGDSEDRKYVMLNLHVFIKSYSSNMKTLLVPVTRVHSFLHFFLRRFDESNISNDFLPLMTEPLKHINSLQFGPSETVTNKRFLDGNLKFNYEEDELKGFQPFSMNIYTALDAFINMKANHTALSKAAFIFLLDLFHKKHLNEIEEFKNLWEFLQFDIHDYDDHITISKIETIDEIYLICFSNFINDQEALFIFTSLKFFRKEKRPNSSTSHQLPTIGNYHSSYKQSHLKRNESVLQEFYSSPLKEEYLNKDYNITMNDTIRIFNFFKSCELLTRYSIKIHYDKLTNFFERKKIENNSINRPNQNQEHIQMKSEESEYLTDEKNIIYRGCVDKIREFKEIPIDVSISKDHYPDLKIHSKKSRKKETNFISNTFPIFKIDKLDGRHISRNNKKQELPPSIDCHSDFFQAIILIPQNYIVIEYNLLNHS